MEETKPVLSLIVKLSIYQKALQRYIEHDSDYLCDCVNRAASKVVEDWYKPEHYIEELLSEFCKQKPEVVSSNIEWWPLHKRQTRIEVLENCIMEVKDLIEKENENILNSSSQLDNAGASASNSDDRDGNAGRSLAGLSGDKYPDQEVATPLETDGSLPTQENLLEE